MNILWTLVNLALDGPAVRAALEGRTEEAQRIRKQMWEEARVPTCNSPLHCRHTHLPVACADFALEGSVGLLCGCFTLLIACNVGVMFCINACAAEGRSHTTSCQDIIMSPSMH